MYAGLHEDITLMILDYFFENTVKDEIGTKMMTRMRTTITAQSTENLRDSCIGDDDYVKCNSLIL